MNHEVTNHDLEVAFKFACEKLRRIVCDPAFFEMMDEHNREPNELMRELAPRLLQAADTLANMVYGDEGRKTVHYAAVADFISSDDCGVADAEELSDILKILADAEEPAFA